MVQHTEDGFEAGTFATFMNPGSQVSAFFSIGEDGTAHQYLPVGRGFVAWAQADGNPGWYSCECEDKLRSGTPMTDIQLTVFAQIYSALAERDGFGYTVTDNTASGRGLITHGDGGNAWGGHPDGTPAHYRKGTLFFHHNSVLSTRTDDTTLFDLPTGYAQITQEQIKQQMAALAAIFQAVMSTINTQANANAPATTTASPAATAASPAPSASPTISPQ